MKDKVRSDTLIDIDKDTLTGFIDKLIVGITEIAKIQGIDIENNMPDRSVLESLDEIHIMNQDMLRTIEKQIEYKSKNCDQDE